MREFNAKAIAFGAIIQFRKLLFSACARTFPTATSSAKEYSYANASFIDAIREICTVNDSLDQAIWAVLPVVFAVSLWHMSFDDTATYNPQHDCLDNNGHMILTAFESLTIGTRTILGKNSSPVEAIRNCKVEFLSISATILLRLRQKSTDKDLNSAKNVSSVLVTLKKVSFVSNPSLWMIQDWIAQSAKNTCRIRFYRAYWGICRHRGH
jgi:hypothetical protein